MRILKGKIENFYPEIINALHRQKTVVLAFDTVYGLIADPKSDKAMEKIYKIKGRDFNRPIALVFAEIAELKKYLIISRSEMKKISQLLPGRYTLILKKRPVTHLSTIYQNLDKLGVRIPDNKQIRELVKLYGSPIAATSANLSGKENCWSVQDFVRQIKGRKHKPDLIIDSGRIISDGPSTVIDLSSGIIIRN